MGVTTSLFVCCLTCSGVAVKVYHYREARPPLRKDESDALAMAKEYFTPGLETELENTGSGRTVCPICCENFGGDGNGELAVLECLHAYHFSCLESYALHRSHSKNTLLLCPVCQKVAVSR